MKRTGSIKRVNRLLLLVTDGAICHSRSMSDLETSDDLRPWSIFEKATFVLVIVLGVIWLVEAVLFFIVAYGSSGGEMSAAQ
jgi:hypothetical protein